MNASSILSRVAACGLALLVASDVRADSKNESLAVAFSGETTYQPLPCDCPLAPLGGWEPRAALLETLDADHVIADTGGWLSADLSESLATLAARALALMPYDAINVGPTEWPWIDAARTAGLPLVCGHPERPSDVPSFRFVALHGRRVAVVGAAWYGRDVLPPVEQVSRALEAAGPVDARVVLCAGGWGYARAIALAHPDVDLVLYGGGALTEEPSDWNGVYGAAPGSKGRYVGRIQLAWGRTDRPRPVLALETVQGSSHPDSDIGRLALEADVMREGGAGAWARKQFSYSEE